ncbi:MAG: DUF3703 domain-containing protein [Deltaproteobacteria bacterium]|nr:DUF3703 domain-containing protein [Myxococcales bacterium]MDP3216669.1 DUF3703 domain-containing protein [Deltaproteobacteria bacterium]
MGSFAHNIRPHVDAELRAADEAEARGQPDAAFTHLERAHVLGQASTVEHVRVHWRMLLWGLRRRDVRECVGQVIRIGGAATKTVFGRVPRGNTGGSNVSPFAPMPIPPDLDERIREARASAG